MREGGGKDWAGLKVKLSSTDKTKLKKARIKENSNINNGYN